MTAKVNLGSCQIVVELYFFYLRFYTEIWVINVDISTKQFKRKYVDFDKFRFEYQPYGSFSVFYH